MRYDTNECFTNLVEIWIKRLADAKAFRAGEGD
jgi:hypothetical protein